MADLKSRLRALLDMRDSWVLAAFYSDPEVAKINSALEQRWRDAGEVGEPLDYASEEEVRRLLSVAERYAYMHPDRARAIALSRMGGEDSEERSLWSRILGGLRKRRD